MLAETSVVTVAAIAVVAVVIFGGVFFAVAGARSRRAPVGAPDKWMSRRDAQREKREAARAAAAAAATKGGSEVSAPVERKPEKLELYAPPVPTKPDPIEVGFTRRQVLNRSALAGSVFGLAAFGGASLAFLIPAPTKGFGGKVAAPGTLDEIKDRIKSDKQPLYVPEGRYYLVPYKAKNEAEAKEIYAPVWSGVQASGLMALYQRCVHLGCKVPFCQSSQWFECPCHGSQYNEAGEKKAGPAPRGLDRFPIQVSGAKLVIDTGKVVLGPTVGTDTTGQDAEGPHCT